MQLLERWLVIQQIHLRWTARHEEINDALGFGREMRGSQGALISCRGRKKIRVYDRTKRRRANSRSHSAKEMAACQQE
jgi:hypothetical protein